MSCVRTMLSRRLWKSRPASGMSSSTGMPRVVRRFSLRSSPPTVSISPSFSVSVEVTLRMAMIGLAG